MMYRVELTEDALRSLAQQGRCTAAFLMGWLRKNLEACTDPRRHGRALFPDHAAFWQYRIGSYRFLAILQDTRIRIFALHTAQDTIATSRQPEVLP